MRENLSRLTAALCDYDIKRKEELVDLINKNVNPPEKVTSEMVHVRAMYLVSDKINSYGGKFDYPELNSLAELVVDAPVMTGHRKDKLPLARIFHAELTEKDNSKWLKCYFYWLKGSNQAEELRNNIDGGIYKECSIGFVYGRAECSVCQKDIRICSHEPFESYKESSGAICFYYYKEIEQVLEASLVYRGAVKDTAITKEFSSDNRVKKIGSISQLDRDKVYLMTPHYEGIKIHFNTDERSIKCCESNRKLNESLLRSSLDLDRRQLEFACGALVGYKGKERCSREELNKYLLEKSSQVSHIELKLFPEFNRIVKKREFKNKFIQMIPYAVGKISKLEKLFDRVKTKEGVCLYEINSGNLNSAELFVISPSETKNNSLSIVSYNNNCTLIKIRNNSEEEDLLVHNFDLQKLLEGHRFVAEESMKFKNDDAEKSLIYKSQVKNSDESKNAYLLKDHRLLIIQEILINRRNCKMVYLNPAG